MSFIHGPKTSVSLPNITCKFYLIWLSLSPPNSLISLYSLSPLPLLHYCSLNKPHVCPPQGLYTYYSPYPDPSCPRTSHGSLSFHTDLCLNNILVRRSLHGLPETALMPLYSLSRFTFLHSFYYYLTSWNTFLWLVGCLSNWHVSSMREGMSVCVLSIFVSLALGT